MDPSIDFSSLGSQIESSSTNPAQYFRENGISLRPMEKFSAEEGYREPEEGEYAPKGSLWNNPMFNKMTESMTENQKKYFEKQGGMYDYDYVNADIDADLKETAEYALMSLRSGLPPIELTDDEKDALAEVHGFSWYIKFGFTEEDVYGEE